MSSYLSTFSGSIDPKFYTSAYANAAVGSNNSNNLSQQNLQASLQRLHARIANQSQQPMLSPGSFSTVASQYDRRRNLTRAPPPTAQTRRTVSFTAPSPPKSTFTRMQTRSQTRALQQNSSSKTMVATPCIAQVPQSDMHIDETPVLNRVLIPRPSASRFYNFFHIRAGSADTIGLRPSMEDEIIVERHTFADGSVAHLWAVLDGHGGDQASKFVAKNWPKTLFGLLALEQLYAGNSSAKQEKIKMAIQVSIDKCHDELHKDLMRRGLSLSVGTTLCSILYLEPKNGTPFFYVINVGDSRALLLNRTNDLEQVLTIDHKPSRQDEYERIWRLGGVVTLDGGVPRVQGNLAVSRSVGDFHLHPFVSHEAAVEGPFSVEKSSGKSFLICCDGVTDALDNEEIASAVAFAATVPISAAGQTVEKQVAEHVRNTAFEKGSSDNISVLFVKIN